MTICLAVLCIAGVLVSSCASDINDSAPRVRDTEPVALTTVPLTTTSVVTTTTVDPTQTYDAFLVCMNDIEKDIGLYASNERARYLSDRNEAVAIFENEVTESAARMAELDRLYAATLSTLELKRDGELEAYYDDYWYKVNSTDNPDIIASA